MSSLPLVTGHEANKLLATQIRQADLSPFVTMPTPSWQAGLGSLQCMQPKEDSGAGISKSALSSASPYLLCGGAGLQ